MTFVRKMEKVEEERLHVEKSNTFQRNLKEFAESKTHENLKFDFKFSWVL